MKQGFLDILTKLQKSLPDVYAAAKELGDNIDFLKDALTGTTRTKGSKNAPNIFRFFDQVSIQAPDPFQNAQFGEPSPYCGLDVNNHIFGLPAVGGWTSTSDSVGTGKYVWDEELFNDPIIFTMDQTTFDELQVNLRGKYLFVASLYITASGAGVAQASMFHEGTSVGTDVDNGAPAGGLAVMKFHKVLDMNAFDKVYFQNATGDRKGNANRYTELTAYRLN